MFEMWKMLFPKLFFSFGDQNNAGGDPDPGNDPNDSGNDGGDAGGDGDGASATDFIELEGAKVPKSALEKYAKENYKDAFDAYENRQKWQSKLTQESQQLSEYRRKAAELDRLMSSRQSGSDPREQYLQTMMQKYPETPMTFFEDQFEWMQKLAGQNVQQSLNPFLNQWSSEQERNFFKNHQDIQPGSMEANQIADLIEKGWSPDDAYEKVAGWANPERRKMLLEKELQDAIKKRDEENRNKLKKQRQGGSGSGVRKPPESFDDAFNDVWDEAQMR